MCDRPRQKLRLLFDDVLAMLAEIAAHDAHAAALAEKVFRRRRDQGGNVIGWVAQIEKARLSILSTFGRTRLASIAADELGVRLAPEPLEPSEPEEAPPAESPGLAKQRPSLLGDNPLGAQARPRRNLLE